MQKKHLSFIDSLRGTACLIVMLAHILASDPKYGMYANGCGKIGVWCFLIISGFLAMQSMKYTKSHKPEKWSTWLITYYKKKLFRLYPTYIAALLFALWIGLLPSFTVVIKHLFCLDGIGHFWYMPVIIKFYLLLPIGYFLYHIMPKRWFLFVHTLTAFLCCLVFPFTSYIENSIQFRWYFPVFIIGMLIYEIYEEITKIKFRHPYLLFIIAIADILVMISFTPLMREILWNITPGPWLQNKYLLYAVLWGILLLALSKLNLPERQNIIHKFIEWVSQYSFELYLFHYLFLSWFSLAIPNTIIRGGAVLLCSMVCSVIINYIFTSFHQRHEL